MISRKVSNAAEAGGEGERRRQQLGELVGEPVVALVAVEVADQLDDEGEHRHGEHEGGEHQVQLGDDPDRDAAGAKGKVR